jgi:LPXTG-motif cell wall-anchored protein
VQLIPSGATGAFRIINLADRATAGGRYELREVEVGMPYVLPTGGKEITPFVVLLDDPVASIIATVIDSAPSVVGNNDRLIYNELRGELPATGGIGMPTFFGIAAAGLVGMFFLWKRTNKHEETPVDID